MKRKLSDEIEMVMADPATHWTESLHPYLMTLSDGSFQLKYHNCGSCGQSKMPDLQQWTGIGFIASSQCDNCGRAIMTMAGEPEFMSFMMKEMQRTNGFRMD